MLDPSVVFIIQQTMGVGLKCQRMRSENVGWCQISESIPPVTFVLCRAEFYAGTLRLNHTRGRTSHVFKTTLFTTPRLWETKHWSGTPCHAYTQTHIRTHSRSKKSNFCIYLFKWNGHSFSYVYYHLRSQYPSINFSVSQSSLKHPHFALPEAFHHAPASCGMAIPEQTWILTHVTFGINSQQPSNSTIPNRNKSLQFNW